jgi:oligopeptide/dipeptide ABC transporter ATP-binding protein
MTGSGRPLRAVDGVSLDLYPGEMLALVGESGSGKTTLAHALVRLVPSTQGKIIHRGRDITHLGGADLRRLRRSFQLVFQDPYESLDPRQTVYQIVEEPLLIHDVGATPAERHEIIDASLRSVGLEPPDYFASRYPHQLSGGQRQRVSIASAIALQPELVVADEPVSMLDVSVRAGILKLMLDLRAQHHFTCLFITHDISLAWALADRIAVLYLGRIVEIGPAADVIRRPRHPYTTALVSVVPVPDPALRRDRVLLEGEPPSPSDVPVGCRFHPRCPLRRRLGNPQECLDSDPALEPAGAAHAAACHFADDHTPGHGVTAAPTRNC